MKRLKFIREPGYIYDLLFIFVLNFNRDFCLNSMINYQKANEDTDFFDRVSLEFGDISDELLLFFYIKDNGKCFFPLYYFFNYKQTFLTTYNFQELQNKISNHERLILNVLNFYFTEINDSEVDFYKNNLRELGKLIDASTYPEVIKRKLYSFFINPVPMIQKLSSELSTMEQLLSKYYDKNYKILVDVQNKMDFLETARRLKSIKYHVYNIDEVEVVYFSICLLNKNCINIGFSDDVNIILLGFDYNAYIDFLTWNKVTPEIDVFGTAVSDKNRLGILDALLQQGEITIKEVEKMFGLSVTNAHYHLTLMTKANILKTRNEGRRVMYSINKNYFDSLIGVIKKYT